MPRTIRADLEPQIGQLLWIGFRGTSFGTSLAALLRRVRPGGVILFGRNIRTARQVRKLTDAIYRALPTPPFIAVDQEGGRVNRLRGIIGPTPSGHSLAHRVNPLAAVRRHAGATAAALGCLGFSVNFAPVLDLSGPETANGIGDRAFGDDPRLIIRMASQVVRSHLRNGVIPVGKHFPGLGAARLDSHLSLPVIRRSRSSLQARDLLPYRQLCSRLPMVMVGHAYYPALQGRRSCPASLSRPVVEGLLRERIGFSGLILTDDLEMGAIDQNRDGGDQALAAFDAGHDGLMFCQSAKRILEAHEALVRAAASGAINRSRLESRLRRIRRCKERFLIRPRRARFSTGRLAAVRELMESLGDAALAGFDPTARA